MKTFKNTKKEIRTEKTGKFSGFFLNAPIKEKIEIFTEAAEKANHDQREIFKRSQLLIAK